MNAIAEIDIVQNNDEWKLSHPDSKNVLLNFIYPIGSVYTTVDDTFDPNTEFGGTWERFSGKYLRARATTDSASETTLGQDSFTVANSNIQAASITSGNESAHESYSWTGSHSHSDNGHGHSDNGHSHGVTDPGHTHNFLIHNEYHDWAETGGGGGTSSWKTDVISSSTTGISINTGYASISTGYASITSTSITVSGTCTGDHTHSTTIGSNSPTAIDNRPASILVNIWKRTA